ncbi:CRISPR-associated protein, Csa1 family [Desulfurococcus amylolyticus DSM 16532]|uniref:CRISPR-associated protein, Csa1 family n=2 Tax=Desulfurococcus amylolyticus TaxID=94694 RepID=I3XSH0_DESAM|nr:CRISPR-associated protein, Csa1 family [Desulfurococcus amylolyticus DSM 16532]
MLSRRLMLRLVRRIYSWSRADPVDEELRGWNWDKPPLKPRAYLDLGVWEVSSKYCGTRRDLWLRRKMGVVVEPSETMAKGKMVHEAIATALREAGRHLSNGLDVWSAYEAAKEKWRRIDTGGSRENARLVEKIYKSTLLSILGEAAYEEALYGSRRPPLAISEYRVDGSNLGLATNLSADLVAEGGVILDIKYGAPREFHKLSLAGYALALESEYEVPYDYGMLIYIQGYIESLKINVKPIYINSYLRRYFIEERDEIIDMLIENREPPRDSTCNPSCPFYKVCNK